MKVGVGPESGGISVPPELGAAVPSPGPEGHRQGAIFRKGPVDMERCSMRIEDRRGVHRCGGVPSGHWQLTTTTEAEVEEGCTSGEQPRSPVRARGLRERFLP